MLGEGNGLEDCCEGRVLGFMMTRNKYLEGDVAGEGNGLDRWKAEDAA